LLEKTRVLHQTDGERNFHIFYQLLAGASPELKTRISLDGTISSYKYLSDDSQMDSEDENNWKTTQECIKSINVDEAMQFQLFSLLSGILHLGNIQFEDKDHAVESITAQTYSAYLTTARMLGVQAEDLLVSMTKQVNLFYFIYTYMLIKNFNRICMWGAVQLLKLRQFNKQLIKEILLRNKYILSRSHG